MNLLKPEYIKDTYLYGIILDTSHNSFDGKWNVSHCIIDHAKFMCYGDYNKALQKIVSTHKMNSKTTSS